MAHKVTRAMLAQENPPPRNSRIPSPARISAQIVTNCFAP